MGVRLSDSVLKAMGYSKYPNDDILEAKFRILEIYSVQGPGIDKNARKTLSDVVKFDENCTVAISNSIQEASDLLMGDIWIFGDDKDEKQFLTENNWKPPFLLVYFEESSYKSIVGGYRQEWNSDNIMTWQAFPKGHIEIQKWKEKVLPKIIVSLTVSFSTLSQPATLQHRLEEVWGKTPNGRNIRDFTMEGHMDLFAVLPKDIDYFSNELKKAEDFYSNLDTSSIRLVYEAFNTSDKKEQILSYFKFAERYTKKKYGALRKEYRE